MSKHIVHDIDNGFTIVGTLDSDNWMEVKVYTLLGRNDAGEILWQDDSGSRPRPTASMDDAEVFLEGHIKWDHCSNWSICPGGMPLHFCGIEDAERVFKIFQRIYALAAEVMPNWD